MKALDEMFKRLGVMSADGRPLYAYEITADEHASLTRMLPLRIGAGAKLDVTAQAFVLWSSEYIRSNYQGGQLTWEFVFNGLSLTPPEYSFTQWLVATGLRRWRRNVRRGDIGHREFLYTLVAEGGLPDAAMAEAGRYASALLHVIAEIEREGTLGAVAADPAARRHLDTLPQALRHEEQARLLADLALALVRLRTALPSDLPANAMLPWLDRNRPNWRSELPLRLSLRALEALVQPALSAVQPLEHEGGPPVQRQLRRDEAGNWVGAVKILDGGLISGSMAPEVLGQRLRLTTDSGASFVAQPEPNGWRIARTSAARLLSLAPTEALVMSVYSDGVHHGNIVLDPGLPDPKEAPTIWTPAEHTATDPDVLVPMSGRGKTRASRAWLLADVDAQPTPQGKLTIESSGRGPGGSTWVVSGSGLIRLGDTTIFVSTSADADSPTPHLHLSGKLLPELRTLSGDPVFLGAPTVWAAEGKSPPNGLGTRAKTISLPRVHGGKITEWIDGGITVARIRYVTLSEASRFSMTEIGTGALRVAAEGLPARFHFSMTVGTVSKHTIVETDGRALIELTPATPPGLVRFRLYDPLSGSALELTCVWPARQPRLIDPHGTLLGTNVEVSSSRLHGWRGHVLGRNGSLVMQIKGRAHQVGFPWYGQSRLAAMAQTICQALAFAGADGRINIRLADGAETPRLSVGRYDWTCELNGSICSFGPGSTHVTALNLDEPSRSEIRDTVDRLDLMEWLGNDTSLWFVQAENSDRGVMRPVAWSATPRPYTTRDMRLLGYESEWKRMLSTPRDPAWDRTRTLLQSVRSKGDASSLDQIQAIARAPEAAVAMLFMSGNDLQSILSLETEVAIWWPIVSCTAWVDGLKAGRLGIKERLAEAGIDDAGLSDQYISQLAGAIVSVRPELKAHLGQAFMQLDLQPLAIDSMKNPLPLYATWEQIEGAAQEAARRFETLPQGTEGLIPTHLNAPRVTNDANAALMQAPLVAAEVAAGLRDPLSLEDTLRLIALRAADPIWFDSALPSALSKAVQISRDAS